MLHIDDKFAPDQNKIKLFVHVLHILSLVSNFDMKLLFAQQKWKRALLVH